VSKRAASVAGERALKHIIYINYFQRFDFVCVQLGSAVARRRNERDGYDGNVAPGITNRPNNATTMMSYNDDENITNNMDGGMGMGMGMGGGMKPNLPPLQMKEIVARRHLIKDGRFDSNFARETPHVLKGSSQATISDLRRGECWRVGEWIFIRSEAAKPAQLTQQATKN